MLKLGVKERELAQAGVVDDALTLTDQIKP
jgi:hypothetical protein